MNSPHFEISGSLSFLQPGAGNLEYGTLTTPLPLPTPNWSNQSLKPDFIPSFTLGARYMADESNDIQLNWTHLHATTNDSFARLADANGGAALFDRPRVVPVQDRIRHGEAQL